jgi:hypothetical protein
VLAVDSAPRTIVVASLNTASLPGHLPPIAQRAAEIGRFLEASGVHVINLQELWGRRYLDLFRRALPSYPFVAWRTGIAGQPRGGLATFSRLPIGQVHYTAFRAARPNTGGPLFRIGMRARSALHGVLTIAIPSARAVVGNAHLVANFDGDWSAGNRHHRLQHAQLTILHQALARARTVTGAELAILSGDLNVASTSPLYPVITDNGAWRDPFAATDPPTFHVEYLPAGSTGQRIDYLLIAGDEQRHRVLDCARILAEPVELPGGLSHLSDHFGLSGTITLG